MTPEPSWPAHIQNALRDGHIDDVCAWLDASSQKEAPLLKASAYASVGQYHSSIEVLTRAMKHLPLAAQENYQWYRGLMYIHAALPALAEQDFTDLLDTNKEHRNLSRLARAYARILLGDIRGALEDNDGLSQESILAIDRVVTPLWIHNFANANWFRHEQKQEIYNET